MNCSSLCAAVGSKLLSPLNAQSELANVVSRLFVRFDAVTKLALKCDRRSISIVDDTWIRIALKRRNLTRLKLRACCEITDVGMSIFSANCGNLQKFSCESCSFGAKGMNALLENCTTEKLESKIESSDTMKGFKESKVVLGF